MAKNATEISYVWNGGPAERGTADLIYSCLFTIFICAWNAVHMNVPADDDGRVMTALRKVKWMLIAIIAPDLIALRSMAEFLSAWTLKTAIRKHMARRGVDGEWTLTHAFLAIMGGISLTETDGSRQRLDSSRLLELIRTGVLEMPHLPREMI